VESSLTRVAVTSKRRRIDVALPAQRPLGEFIPQLVAMVGGDTDGPTDGWHMVRLVGEVLADDRTLAESKVLDGELLILAPRAPAPHGDGALVDDVSRAVAASSAPAGQSRQSIGHVFHSLAAAGGIGLAVVLTAGGSAGGWIAALAAATMLLGAGLLQSSGQVADASIWGFTAVAPAIVAGWTLGTGYSAVPGWTTAGAAGAVTAFAAAAFVPSRADVLVPLGAGMLTATVWSIVVTNVSADPVPVAAWTVLVGLLLVELTPAAAFRLMRVGSLARRPVTQGDIDLHVQRARRMIVAGNVSGSTLVVLGAVVLAADTDPWGWTLAGLGGALLAVHARIYRHLRELLPLAAAGVLVATLLAALTVVPEAGWELAAASCAAGAAALATCGVLRPALRPLVRRRLAQLEVLACVPLLAAVAVATGLTDAIYRAGQNLG
jgi:type VII secretion integral membrane protein EccD